MKPSSTVTVIIPCFNDGAYIMEALQSIWNQTVVPHNIIIIDDGSNESTKKVLKKIQQDRVTIIHQENQGVSVARNEAIRLADTPYILNLDADDYYEPTFIEKAIQILDTDVTIGVVSSSCRTFSEKKTISIVRPLGGGVTDFLFINNGRASAMFRKECWEKVGGFDENMKAGYEDWEFWLAITKNNWRMHIIPEILSHYRIKNTSRDRTAIVHHDYELRMYIFNKHKEMYQTHFEFYASALLRQNSILRNSLRNAKESKEFQLGNLLLAPLRFFKKIVSR
ncbi:glycosyltransferase family 2 protein [Flavobacterium sp. CHNK8]|uniref:glycosyltransferase family 2 protein n=1 Tax=Flavobacterium sp. CHNK8 TaxID=2871165 RepID=UPI001C8E64EF|nr:glycosyltransferase family A protein [Flavobacterium sp. CHNK8]QZK89623.1 glycosyltransferase family 2 protein [Flavobacterium sp. CHNK8]